MAVANLNNYTVDDGFGMPLNIRRGNPNPLDNSDIWPSAVDATNYARHDPTAYVGQIISWYSTDAEGNQIVKAAQILNEDGDLKMLSDGNTSGQMNLEEITEKQIDDILFSVFGV